ncbi:MAG: DUF502 domain-containing protein [Planctomycetes bacterium]|nr:DUF502 domain-containing protein [Planctomycetota bacterium]MBI3848338.1 DUF502 domain-containing protein [Planctomycetota bacterium]
MKDEFHEPDGTVSPWRSRRLRWLRRHLRTKLTAGIIVLVPIYVTAVILTAVFKWMDGILAPLVLKVIHIPIPGLGIIFTLLVVYLVGLGATQLFGQHLIESVDRFLSNLPLVKTLYGTFKQISQQFTPAGRQSFKRVVFVDYPRQGVKVIGFVTGTIRTEDGRSLLNVFIPTTPNPTGGMLVLVPESEVIETSLTVEEGMKLVLSSGIVSPDTIRVDDREPGGPAAV